MRSKPKKLIKKWPNVMLIWLFTRTNKHGQFCIRSLIIIQNLFDSRIQLSKYHFIHSFIFPILFDIFIHLNIFNINFIIKILNISLVSKFENYFDFSYYFLKNNHLFSSVILTKFAVFGQKIKSIKYSSFEISLTQIEYL